jgi:hypothetical protein
LRPAGGCGIESKTGEESANNRGGFHGAFL